MVNTSQQVGGSVGTALLSTIFASATAPTLPATPRRPESANAAAIHGYTTAFAWAAGIFALGLLLALLILPSKAQVTVSVPTPAVPTPAVGDGKVAAPKVAEPVTPILVTGPCCHFAVTVRPGVVTLRASEPELAAAVSRSTSEATPEEPSS